MVRLAVAFAALPLLLIAVGAPLTAGDPMPPRPFEISLGGESVAATILVQLSSTLGTTALTVIAAAAVLLRVGERTSIDGVDRVMASLAVAGAALSYFFGYRFQIDLASQLSQTHLNLLSVIDRLEWQGYSFVFAACCLMAMAADRLTGREGRR